MKVRQESLFAALVLTLLPVPAFGQEPPGSEVEVGSAHVSGTVVEHASGEALSGVSVTLRAVEGAGTAVRRTGHDGRFRFSSVKAQAYQVEIALLGYKEAAVEIRPGEGDEARIDVEMVATVVELEPLVVTATRRSLLHRTGFHDRRRGGLGRFLTREDVAASNVFRVSDLFRRISGFRVATDARGAGNHVLGRGNCPPVLYVDGVRTLEGVSMDELLHPDAVEGLEVYHASETPSQFRGGRCGTVVAWTRTPDPGQPGEPLGWRRVFYLVGLIGLAVTATQF